jgi:hypothetical protein
MEQQVNIKFCFKLGKTGTETHEMLEPVGRYQAVFCMHVLKWLKI